VRRLRTSKIFASSFDILRLIYHKGRSLINNLPMLGRCLEGSGITLWWRVCRNFFDMIDKLGKPKKVSKNVREPGTDYDLHVRVPAETGQHSGSQLSLVMSWGSP